MIPTPDLAALAIKFALSFKDVSSVLVGIDRMDYLHRSLAAADDIYLDEKTLSRAGSWDIPIRSF